MEILNLIVDDKVIQKNIEDCHIVVKVNVIERELGKSHILQCCFLQ